MEEASCLWRDSSLSGLEDCLSVSPEKGDDTRIERKSGYGEEEEEEKDSFPPFGLASQTRMDSHS
jgi:hypothetical protein